MFSKGFIVIRKSAKAREWDNTMSNNNVWLSGLLVLDSAQSGPDDNTVQIKIRTDSSVFGGQHSVILEKGAAQRFYREDRKYANTNIRTRGASISGSLVSQYDSAIVLGKRITFHDSHSITFINQVWLQGLLRISGVQNIAFNGSSVNAIRGWVFTGQPLLGCSHPLIVTSPKPQLAIINSRISPDTKSLPEVLVQGYLVTVDGMTTVNVKRVDFLGNISSGRRVVRVI